VGEDGLRRVLLEQVPHPALTAQLRARPEATPGRGPPPAGLRPRPGQPRRRPPCRRAVMIRPCRQRSRSFPVAPASGAPGSCDSLIEALQLLGALWLPTNWWWAAAPASRRAGSFSAVAHRTIFAIFGDGRGRPVRRSGLKLHYAIARWHWLSAPHPPRRQLLAGGVGGHGLLAMPPRTSAITGGPPLRPIAIDNHRADAAGRITIKAS
jgi:hypothetical protein